MADIHKELQDLLGLYLVDDRKLADEFEVAVSTVKRWRIGTARPHPKLTQLIVDYLKSKRVERKAEFVLHHDDPPCKARLQGRFCPECNVVADMQSTCFYFYCPDCNIPLTTRMTCTKCNQTFTS